MELKPFSNEFVEELRKADDLKVQSYLKLVRSIDREVHKASRFALREAADDAGVSS